MGDRLCDGTAEYTKLPATGYRLPAKTRRLWCIHEWMTHTERIAGRYNSGVEAGSWELRAERAMLRFSSPADDVDQTRLRARLHLIEPFSGGSRRLPDSL